MMRYCAAMVFGLGLMAAGTGAEDIRFATSYAEGIGLATTSQQDVMFPSGANVINVRQSPYNATGNGMTDDTRAIQAAITEAQDTDRIVYFPNGTYRLTNTLVWEPPWRRVTLQGQSESGVVLKLDNNATGFGSGANKPVLNLCTGGEYGAAFRNQIFDLTVDIGAGNSGAIGIRFLSNNQGGMRNVTIRSSDTANAGSRGLDLTHKYPGPSLFRNITISGFDYSIYSDNREFSLTFERLSLMNPRLCGIWNKDQIMTIRGLTYTGNRDIPVIHNTSESPDYCQHFCTWGMISLLDASLANTSASKASTAIENVAGILYCRNVTSSGFAALITNTDAHGTRVGVAGSSTSEYSSHAVKSLFGSPTGALKLEVEEAPFYDYGDTRNWIGVSGFTSADIQTAINACTATRSTVYLPAGAYSLQMPISISGHVRRIIGLGATLSVDGALRTSSNNVFTFGDMSHGNPVMFENFWSNFEGGPFTFFYNNSANVVVIRDVTLNNLGGGGYAYRNSGAATKLFIDDVLSYKGWKFDGGRIWARNFNVECYNEADGDANIKNNGATLWVLGLKTERRATILNNTSGARTEIVGGLGYPGVGIVVPDGRPAFINNESSLSATFGFSCYSNGGIYTIAVKETGGSVTRTCANTDFPSRTYGGAFAMPLYVGETDTPVTSTQRELLQLALKASADRVTLRRNGRGTLLTVRSGEIVNVDVYSFNGSVQTSFSAVSVNGSVVVPQTGKAKAGRIIRMRTLQGSVYIFTDMQ